MPIDSSIYQSLANVKPVDVAGSIVEGMKISQFVKENKKQAGLNEAYQKALEKKPDGSIGLNRPVFLSILADKGFGQEALAASEKFAQQDALKKTQQMEQGLKTADLIGRVSSTIVDQPSYDRALQTLQSFGIDVSQEPKQYDPNYVRQHAQMALSYKDQLEQQLKQSEFGIKKENLGIDKERLSLERQRLENEKVKKSTEVETELRKERSGLKTTQATQDVAAAYNKIQNAAKQPSAAGDMSLIFGYMKILDPGSTVREGEFANAQQATGVPGQVLNAYNNALKGERLNEQQRKDFMNQAKNLYEAQMSIQKQIDKQYGALAEKAGAKKENVLLNFEAQQQDQQKPQFIEQNGHTYELQPDGSYK